MVYCIHDHCPRTMASFLNYYLKVNLMIIKTLIISCNIQLSLIKTIYNTHDIHFIHCAVDERNLLHDLILEIPDFMDGVEGLVSCSLGLSYLHNEDVTKSIIPAYSMT